jgi:putative SOS response-associated peptidase YedK
MSGRFTLAAAPEAVAAQFGVGRVAWFPPRYNIAPSQPIAIVRHVRGQREFALVRWGFVPSWSKDPRRYGLLINARAEGLLDKAAFRGAIQYRRCLIPATGYYHWERSPGETRGRPWFVRPRDGGLWAYAGLWDPWLGADGSEIDGAAIVTVAAGPDLVGIADRMPAVILPRDYERWLDSDRYPAAAAASLLRPAAGDSVVAVPVGERVNRVANDGPDLIEPAGGGAG